MIKLDVTKRQAKQALPILKSGLKLLETKGWCQSKMKNAEGQYCALGALSAAAGRRAYWNAETILTKVIQARTKDPYTSIVHYNDAVISRKSQITSVFKRAIVETNNVIKGAN